VVEHSLEGFPCSREPAVVSLHSAANGAQDSPEEPDDVRGTEETHRAVLGEMPFGHPPDGTDFPVAISVARS
jgi:hypothetical protein